MKSFSRFLHFLLLSVLLLALTSFLPFVAQAKTNYLTVPTATMSGTYYQYFSAVSQIFSQKQPDINITVTASAGAIENIKLLQNGESELIPTNAAMARFAFNGENVFKSKVPLRGMFVMFQSNYHFLTMDKKINSFEDLVGKKVSIGLGSSLMEQLGRVILTEKGLIDKVTLRYLSIAESCAALKDGSIDAALLLSTLPLSPVMELATSRAIRFIPIQPETAALAAKTIACSPDVIKAGVYPSQTVDVPSIALYEAFFAHKDASVDLVYTFLKVLYDNKPDLMLAFPGAAKTTPELCMEGMSVPLHPGAYKYYVDQGVTVPDHLKPID